MTEKEVANILKKKTCSIIYIGGYGRSGSTILDIVLQNAGAGSLGALSNLPTWLKFDHLCSCGEKFSCCSFWKDIEPVLRQHNFGYNLFASFDCSKIENKNVKDINEFYRVLFEKLPNNGFIIDSSKTTRDTFLRPYRLSKGFNVYFVHVVRDPLAIANSAMQGAGSPERIRVIRNKYFQFTKALVLGHITNFMTSFCYRRYFREKYLRVSFESLQNNPQIQLRAIGQLTGLPVEDLIRKIKIRDELTVGHMLGGNRLRFSKSLKFGIQDAQ